MVAPSVMGQFAKNVGHDVEVLRWWGLGGCSGSRNGRESMKAREKNIPYPSTPLLPNDLFMDSSRREEKALSAQRTGGPGWRIPLCLELSSVTWDNFLVPAQASWEIYTIHST